MPCACSACSTSSRAAFSVLTRRSVGARPMKASHLFQQPVAESALEFAFQPLRIFAAHPIGRGRRRRRDGGALGIGQRRGAIAAGEQRFDILAAFQQRGDHQGARARHRPCDAPAPRGAAARRRPVRRWRGGRPSRQSGGVRNQALRKRSVGWAVVSSPSRISMAICRRAAGVMASPSRMAGPFDSGFLFLLRSRSWSACSSPTNLASRSVLRSPRWARALSQAHGLQGHVMDAGRLHLTLAAAWAEHLSLQEAIWRAQILGHEVRGAACFRRAST